MPLRLSLFLLLSLSLVRSAAAASEATYTFAVVPQQSAIRTAETWGPVVQHLNRTTGYRFVLRSAHSIPEYTDNLRRGLYDVAYMNPYHFVTFEHSPGYLPLVKARDKRITGILVVTRKDPSQGLADLQGRVISFPSEDAFGASLLPRKALDAAGIQYTPNYVTSHDSVYLSVASGFSSAGGGVMRTFANMKPEIRDQLRVLWKSEGHSPHVVAARKTVPEALTRKVRQALIDLAQSPGGTRILKGLKIKGFEKADSREWDDVRALALPPL